MKKPKKSEKLLLEDIFLAGKILMKNQRGLEVGSLIMLIRNQLKMSQRTLAKRAGVPQSTTSRIESGRTDSTISTLKRIVEAMGCYLLITVVPREDLETFKKEQALVKAQKKIHYLHGTMSLEKQAPNSKLLQELIKDEVNDLINDSGSRLWEES